MHCASAIHAMQCQEYAVLATVREEKVKALKFPDFETGLQLHCTSRRLSTVSDGHAAACADDLLASLHHALTLPETWLRLRPGCWTRGSMGLEACIPPALGFFG